MHQFDLYGSEYKYILAGIDAASRNKVARPLRTKQTRDVAEMIADIYKVGPLMYASTFQCDNGSEFKGEVTKMLEKQEVKIEVPLVIERVILQKRYLLRMDCINTYYTLVKNTMTSNAEQLIEYDQRELID